MGNTLQTSRSRTASHVSALYVVGLGSLLAYVLLMMLSQLSFPNYEIAFELQAPLTLTFDLGVFGGVFIAWGLLCMGEKKSWAWSQNGLTLVVLLSYGLLLGATLAKGGVFGVSKGVILVGDFLVGLPLPLIIITWWQIIFRNGLHRLVNLLAAAGFWLLGCLSSK